MKYLVKGGGEGGQILSTVFVHSPFIWARPLYVPGCIFNHFAIFFSSVKFGSQNSDFVMK